MSTSIVIQEYLDHFKQTPSLYASCTNEQNQPETTRAFMGWGDIEANTLSFAVSDSGSQRFLTFAEPGNRMALVSVTLSDYLTYQYKGTLRSVRPCTADERKEIDAYVDGFCSLVAYVGLDPERYKVGFAGSSYSVITFEVDAVFDQTPRVGAGALLSSKTK